MPARSHGQSLLGYQLRLGRLGVPYDEMLQPDGRLREHWREVIHFFERLGPEEISRRWAQARKVLHDNGVAYNTQSQGGTRAWELNPVPLCLPASEWQGISIAIRQRARLLNHLLNDLYGPQKLVAKGLVPPALVFGNSAFLRPCHGVKVTGDARLAVYGVDIARAPNGDWWVISDRTQAPSGMGYTLENRLVFSRIFPEIFREARIARLGGFLSRFRTALGALSPRPGTEPVAVLLTPGPLNETYFEQAYLARHLGCPLVQGQDLAVRDGRVFIKTLDGLRQVDVIFRRVDDDYCDPLELRDDSLLGIPGLLGAVRRGTVTLANALGSGLVQSAAFSAFLPGLSRAVFGEDLLMPSIATWWCGDDAARQYVRDNLPALVLKDAFDYPGDSIRSEHSLERLRRAIEDRPSCIVAQEFVRLSQCPDFAEAKFDARSIVLRVFAVRVGDDYEVLPGGLTRVADEESSYGVLLQQTGGSKDTWVEMEPGATPAPPAASIDFPRSNLSLTSSIADNLFWLGRYAERADSTARLTRCALENSPTDPDWSAQGAIRPLLETLRHFGQFQPPRKSEPFDTALSRQVADPLSSGSIVSIIRRLRALAGTVRDQISNDTWRILNVLGDAANLSPSLAANEAALELNDVILALSAFQGLLSENMPHGYAWRFLDLGRKIERGIYLARLAGEILQNSSGSPIRRFELLLETQDAVVTYRQKYPATRVSAVLDLVLCDESNPRSLASQFAAGMQHLQRLPREADGAFKLPEERRLLASLSDLRLLDLGEVATPAAREGIRTVLSQAEKALSDCSELITLRFFTHLHTSSVGRDRVLAEMPPSL